MFSQEFLASKNYKLIKQIKLNVYLIEHIQTKEQSILKVSEVGVFHKKEFEEQMNFLKKLDSSDAIVSLEEYFYDKDSNAYVVMEFCESGDLRTLIKKRKLEKKRFSEIEIVRVLHSIFIGLSLLRQFSIIHRDIKTENILITKDFRFKLADFDVSRVLKKNEEASTLKGSINYMAPEIFSGNSYSFSADYFSAGAVLYELMTLSPVETKAVLSKTVSVNPSLGYSQWLVDLVLKLLSVDPAQRPTPQAVLSNPVLPMALLQGSVAELSATVTQQNVRMGDLEKTVAQQKERIAVLETTVACITASLPSPITAGSAAQALDSLQVEVDGVLRPFVRKIPHLKSDVDQGYRITCSSQFDDTHHACYFPFSGRSEKWATVEGDVCNSWIEIALPKSERFNVLVLRSRWDYCLEQSPTVFSVCGWRADTDWCDLGMPFVVEWESLNEEKHLYFANDGAFDKYRIKFQQNQNGTGRKRMSGYISVSLIDFGLVT